MRHSWVSTYRFDWSPPITFLNRALRLAERVETELSPVAFNVNEDHIGFAVQDRDVRVSVTLPGINIVLGPSTESVSDLSEAIDLILQVFSPTDLSMVGASDNIIVPLDDEYDLVRARLAERASGIDGGPGGLRPIDTAILLDLVDDAHHFQVEYGVVTADEGAQRICQPDGSRSDMPYHGLPARSLRNQLKGKLPDVGILTYGHTRKLEPSTVEDVQGLIGQVEDVQARFDVIAKLVAQRAAPEGGEL